MLDPQAKYSGWLFDAGNLIWKAVPESPLGGRGGNLDPIVVAFVDGRLVAWGTSHPGPDGAVLDPKTMTWAPMARAPIKGRHRTPHAALGHKLIVWGGLPNFLQDGAIYDVRRDEWAALPPAPVAFRYGTASAMWRGKFVVVGGTMRGDASRTGAIYDPEINAWEQIEPAPFDVGCMSACAVAGDQLFLWSGPKQMRDAAATYDLVKKQWKAIAPAPMVGRVLAFARPVGSEVIVWGGWVSNPQEAFLPDGAVYDLTTDTWRAIPHLPFDVPKALHPGW